MSIVDPKLVALLSDTVLYSEAQTFAAKHQLPDGKQLIGLATYGRTWNDLLRFIGHQAGRDWGERTHYKTFYDDLRRYLNDPTQGLRQRVKSEFKLIGEGLSNKDERVAQDVWAQALEQEFIQHLVAEARLRVQA